MIYLPTEHLKPGMVLARDIYFFVSNPYHVPLLTKGQKLTSLYINKIKARNISGVYIVSSVLEDVEVSTVIDEQLRTKAMADIITVFKAYETDGLDPQAINKIRNVAKDLVLSILSKDKVLLNLIELKTYDDYTYSHCLCVAITGVIIGVSLGLTEKMLNDIAMAALLHDIGKQDISIDIINKPTQLSDEEYNVIKAHPQNAVERLKKQNLVSPMVLSGILSHHEKCDGTGYPLGLSGKDIPFYGKVLAVADVYDALTSNRPYRKAWFPSEAIEYMMGCTDTHFDFEILTAFLKNVTTYPVGTYVTLSNGQHAVVVKHLSENTLRPVVRIIEEDGSSGGDINLLSDMNYINTTIVGMGYNDEGSDFETFTVSE